MVPKESRMCLGGGAVTSTWLPPPPLCSHASYFLQLHHFFPAATADCFLCRSVITNANTDRGHKTCFAVTNTVHTDANTLTEQVCPFFSVCCVCVWSGGAYWSVETVFASFLVVSASVCPARQTTKAAYTSNVYIRVQLKWTVFIYFLL